MRFYGSDKFLAASVTDFVICGLRAGEVCAVFASRAHLSAIEAGLAAAGFDLEEISRNGGYRSVVTGTALSALLVDGLPEKSCFLNFIGTPSENSGGPRTARIYEELSAALDASGNKASSRLLEHLWFEVANDLNLTLYSSYSAGEFSWPPADETQSEFTGTIRDADSAVPLVPSDDLLRDPDYLRIRARELNAELAELERKIATRKKDIG